MRWRELYLSAFDHVVLVGQSLRAAFTWMLSSSFDALSMSCWVGREVTHVAHRHGAGLLACPISDGDFCAVVLSVAGISPKAGDSAISNSIASYFPLLHGRFQPAFQKP